MRVYATGKVEKEQRQEISEMFEDVISRSTGMTAYGAIDDFAQMMQSIGTASWSIYDLPAGALALRYVDEEPTKAEVKRTKDHRSRLTLQMKLHGIPKETQEYAAINSFVRRLKEMGLHIMGGLEIEVVK